jgi:exonuclease SbcD
MPPDAPPIRLIHTADIHIGMENYGRLDPVTGINSRVMDFLRRLTDVANFAIEQEADVFIFAGDAYRTREPSPTHQREFARRIKRVADAGIPVVMLVGNHDLPAVSRRASSIDIFGTLGVPNVHVANREQVLQLTCRRGQVLQVAAMPYPQRSALLAAEAYRGRSLEELDRALQEAMITLVRGLALEVRERPSVPAILVGHFSVDEAVAGSERSIMVGRDAAMPRSVLADPTWRYVALGHIHKHQNLNPSGDPPVVYSGSLERIDFGEEHERKGFVVVEIGEGPATWEFRPAYRRQARPFTTIGVDVREAADPTAAVVEAVRGRGDLSESVVRLVVQLRQSQEPLLVERDIARALEGAYFVGKLQKEVERHARDRLGGVSVESLSPAQILERYLETRAVPGERRDRLLKAAAELVSSVDAASAS